MAELIFNLKYKKLEALFNGSCGLLRETERRRFEKQAIDGTRRKETVFSLELTLHWYFPLLTLALTLHLFSGPLLSAQSYSKLTEVPPETRQGTTKSAPLDLLNVKEACEI